MPQKEYQRITHAVWEITLKCNLACSHCGSRAGDARTNELSTSEALDMVRQLADVEKPSILPRRGWQDRQAFRKTLIKTKLLLEICEIEDLVSRRSINKKP